jgi:hypothetical protein
MNKYLLIAAFGCLLSCLSGSVWAQAPDVPIIHQSHESAADSDLIATATKLRENSLLMSLEDVKGQRNRRSCQLALPEPLTSPLSASQIWSLSRKAHLRIGYLYLCSSCSKMHLNLAGAYVLTANGAVATCYHVVCEPKYCTKGHLVAVTQDGEVLPVTEVLAGDKSSDVCIVRVRSRAPLQPLSLNVNIAPGDLVWCYSDPLGHEGYFTQGIVNRFYQDWDDVKHTSRSSIRMNVSTDWAPGSSGSAVLDRFGNAVGHVAKISAKGIELSSDSSSVTNHTEQTVIVYHEATCAAEVMALVKP